MKARYVIIAAFSFLAMAACQQIEPETLVPETVPASSDSLFTLTVQASKGFGTKALWIDDSGATDVLKAYWNGSEAVTVFRNGTDAGTLGVTTPGSGEKPATAKLTGTISVPDLTVGDHLLLMLPRDSWDYTGQNGSLATLETTYDYATATVTVSSIDGSDVTTEGTADFSNEQSVYRFDFKVNSALQAVKGFIVSSSQNKLVTSRSYSSGWNSAFGSLTVSISGDGSISPYMSLRNENISADDTYSFMVTGSDDALYTGTKLIPADKLGNGKFLAPSVTLTQPSFAPAASGSVDDSAEVL